MTQSTQTPKKPRNIAVFDENMKPVAPCSERTAWALVTRKRAVYLNETQTEIQVIVSKRAIQELKRKIIEDAGRICYICGRYIPPAERATVDHLYPKYIDSNEISGLDTEENMRCCCEECNHHKGNMDIVTYLAYRIMIYTVVLCTRMKTPVTRRLLMRTIYGEDDEDANSITSNTATADSVSDTTDTTGSAGVYPELHASTCSYNLQYT